MKASRKFLSLPIVSLREGQHIGYVKNLIIDAQNKCIAALVIDPKGFFKDQRIIPYSKVISVGEDAITIDKGSQVEKPTNLPEILDLIKQKVSINGTKIVTESGKTLGFAEEYFVDVEDGKIVKIEISGGKLEGILNGKALLDASSITTIGQDIIVVQKGSENCLDVAEKGLNDSLKAFWHSTSHVASETTNSLGNYMKKFRKDPKNSIDENTIALDEMDKNDMNPESPQEEIPSENPPESEQNAIKTSILTEIAAVEEKQSDSQNSSTKEPLG